MVSVKYKQSFRPVFLEYGHDRRSPNALVSLINGSAKIKNQVSFAWLPIRNCWRVLHIKDLKLPQRDGRTRTKSARRHLSRYNTLLELSDSQPKTPTRLMALQAARRDLFGEWPPFQWDSTQNWSCTAIHRPWEAKLTEATISLLYKLRLFSID